MWYSEVLLLRLAPMVAAFSSRGINSVNPDIIKPDITAPGVDILATITPPTDVHTDSRSVKYNIISGTSMSCPHVSGLAAYIKAAHPTWSPSAMKSAIMTTANAMDPVKNEDAELAYGSGHINPLRALRPGLVYDADESDYINFLCKNGYNSTAILRQLTGDSSVCQDAVTTGNSWDLNYPSFAVAVADGEYINATFTRTVTNVGSHISTYHVAVNTPGLAEVVVEPTILKFNTRGQKRKFTVKVTGPKITQQSILSGSITWSDGKHLVRSPLVVFNAIPLWAEIYTVAPRPSHSHNHKHRIYSRLNN